MIRQKTRAAGTAEAPRTSGLIHRFREAQVEAVRAEDGSPTNRIRVIASTDEECDWGYYVEKLVHTEEAIDRTVAVSSLFNHDRNRILGKIVATKVEGGQLRAEIEIDPDVKLPGDLNALKAVREGYLKGISIGYEYRYDDCTITYIQNEVTDSDGYKSVRNKEFCTVNRWILREISFTPTPKDLAAQVTRQLPESLTGPSKANLNERKRTMNFNAWLRARGFDPESLNETQRAALKADFEAQRGTTSTAVADKDDEIAKERAALAEREKKVERKEFEVWAVELAKSHGVELSKEDLADLKSREQALQLMLTRKAVAGIKTNPKHPVHVEVTRDAADKLDAAAADGLINLIPREFRPISKDDKDLGMRAGSVLDIGRRWLAGSGVPDVVELGKEELADMLIGRGGRLSRFARARALKSGMRDAANVTSGMFTSYLLANVMDKVVYNGFMAPDEAITYHLWTASRQVSDFKTYSGAALDVGNLTETAENVAFPELAKAEGGYSDALKMWGATLSLTLQALINDDLGQFMSWLGRAGFIARRTIDVKVYTALAAATWTSRTTANSDLSDTTLSALRTSLAGIAGPAGQTLGMNARYLIVPAGLRSAALTITQIAPYIAPSDVKVNTDIIPIITPFLATAGTPSQSTWYLAASQAFEPVIVANLAGMQAPVVEEYDPGAVAARKWKIMMPFQVTIPTVSSKVAAMWQGTH